MAYISVSLSQNDPQPGNYSIYIQDCNGGLEVLVDENLINPTDFPYTINTDDFINYDDCINYRVVETLSGCESTGVIRPTGTGSTPTPTPTTTVQDDDHIDISFSISEGSTIINFNASASKQVTKDTVIDFNYVLYRNDGTSRTIPVSMTILNGNSSVSKEVRLKDEVYSNVDNSVQSIKGITSNNDEFVINRYTEKSISNSKISYVNYDFVSCCDKNNVITARVDSASSEKWIRNGNVVMFKGHCYRPSSLSRKTEYLTTFFGPDYISCKSSECPDCTQPTPTPTPSSIVNRLGGAYTLRTVEGLDGELIDVNIKNSILYRKSLKYNGKCYTILEDVEQRYDIGINDIKKPIINDRDVFDNLNFCKVSLGKTLSLTIKELQEVSPNNIKKIPFSPKIGQSLTNLTVNAFANCGETVRNPDIFVFYDATGSYQSDEIQITSNSVRQWYTSLLVQGLGNTEPDQDGEIQTSYTGRLFEAPFKKKEQVLSLASYPTLGSLSGGTLPALNGNDEQVIVHNPAWDTQFKTNANVGTFSEEMLNGVPYGIGGDTYVDPSGVSHPFSGHTHPAAASQILVGNAANSINSTAGNISQEYLDLYNDGLPFTDAIVIIFSNEFGEGLSDSTTSPQVSSGLLQQDLWAGYLDNYYKVWRYNIDSGKPPLNFIFSNPKYDGNLQTSSAYLYGNMALMEMTNINTTELQEKYSQNYFEDGSEVDITWPFINPYLNNNDNGNGLFYNDFSLLETEGADLFSWVDGTSVPTYGEISSNTSYSFYTQNGPGLSNYGFTLDVNLSTYNVSAVRDRLTSYINLALENALSGYILLECDPEVLDDNYVCFNAGQIVLYNGNCYEVVTNLLQGENPYYETGIFVLDDEIYTQISSGSQSDFVANIDDCENCKCSEESGLDNTNWRVSVVLVNDNSVDTQVTVHGVYMPNSDLLTTQGVFTIPANGTLTVYGYQLVPDACISMDDTMNGLPFGTYVDSMGDCCDPTDPVEPTPSPTPSATPSATPSVTPSITPSATPSATPSSTPPPSLTPTPTNTVTPTVTPTITPTPTTTPSVTPTSTITPTPSGTPGESPTPTPSITTTPSSTPYVCDDSQYTINYNQVGFVFSSDCHLDDLVFTISVSGPQEPVSGQLNLISIFGDDGTQLTQLIDTVDFTAVYTGNNLITVTISPEVYLLYQTENPNANPTVSTFEITVETPFGCVLTSTAELQTCQCPEFQMFKPCDESGIIIGELEEYTGSTDTYSYQGNVYTVPMSITDICDLSPLATLLNGVYVITLEAFEAAYYYHLANQSNPNVVSTFIATATQPYAVVNSSDLAYFQSISNDGILYVLNDYLNCFNHENMIYLSQNEVPEDFNTPVYVLDIDGEEACYEYIGQVTNCDGSIELTPGFNGVIDGPYVDCPDCINTNFPTPTPTPTPSTSAPSNYCEIQVADFGYKSTSLGNIQVNVISNYLQLPTLDTVYAYSEQHDGYNEVLPYHNEPQGENEWQYTLVNPSLCTYHKSFDMWQTTTLVNGVAQNQEMWENIRVNRITKPIYIGCDSDCRRNTVLRDQNSVAISWGTFKNGFLEYGGSQNDDYVTTLPLVVYDENVDTVYRIATLDILQAIDNGSFLNGYNYNVSDTDILFVEEVSNCETNDDIFVTDSPGGGWLIDGETNPTLSFEDGKTYRFHVNSNKDFWIGYNNESTVQVNINEDDPCVDAVWVDTINPNSILNTCDLTDNFCNSSTATAESDCGQIVHEKTSPWWTNLTTKNKTVIFRPKCDHNCNRHLFYYDRLDTRDCDSIGRMLIKDASDCSEGVVVTHYGTLSEETGLVPGLVVTWSDCEGNGYSDVVVYPYEPTQYTQIPYHWTIPGCVNVDSITITPIHVTDGDDVGFEGLRPEGEQYNIGKCWCGSRIDVTAGENCWEACGTKKPNFANADKITPLYRQKDGVKAVKDSTILKLMDEAPDIIGVVNTRRAKCCSNCDVTGLSKVNYKYWLAKNCCDPSDTTMVRVFDEPTTGQGFSYVDRNDELLSGEYPIYCYEFTHEVLMGCAWDRRMGMTIPTSRFVDDICNNAVDDYDTAIATGRCLGCPQDAPRSCNIPYGDVIQTSTSAVSVFSLDYGGNNPQLGLPAQTITIDFEAGKTPNRVQVYKIHNNDDGPYTSFASQQGQFDYDNDSNLSKVADSLWVGGQLSGYVSLNTPQYNTFLSVFNQMTSSNSVYDLEFWRYYGDCENTWSVANNSPTDYNLWTNQQSQNVNIVYPGMTQSNSIPQSHIPVNPGGTPITRAEGFQGQLNVDPNYPTQGGLSLASDGKVRFKFTKPSGQWRFLVVVWGYNGEKDGWTLSTECPEVCGVETNLLFSENQDCLPNSESPNITGTINFDGYPYEQYGIPELDLEASFSFNNYSDNYFNTLEASVPQYTYGNWFQPQQSGYYDFKLLFDIRTSGAATEWVQILPTLFEWVEGTSPHQQGSAGNDYDSDNNVYTDGTWRLVADHDNISTHFCNSGYYFIPPESASPIEAHTYSACGPVNVGGHYHANFSNVYLDSSKKYFFGFIKTWIPGYPVPGTDAGLFDSPDLCNPEQTLYIYDAIMYTLDYTPSYSLTTLFVNGNNPNSIEPCDKVFLDPCCSVPANGSVSILQSNGTVNNININNGQVTFTDCIEYLPSNPCDDWFAPWINGSNIFIPNCELTSTWSPIVNPGLVDCTNYRLDVFNRWGELIWVGTVNQPWDGTVGNLSQTLVEYQQWEDQFSGPWDIDCCGPDSLVNLVFQGVYTIKVTVWSTSNSTFTITEILDVTVEPDCIQ